jgi:hypothetical protein
MHAEEASIPEEIVELSYHFLPPQRQSEIDEALRALQEDTRLEFMLAVLEVRINDRGLSPTTPPSRSLLHKLLQALDEESGAVMLYTSPYNDLGAGRGSEASERLEWWNFDLAPRLCRFQDLRSVRAFLEHGTGRARGRDREEAQRLHDRLLHGLVGDSTSYSIWGCSNVRTPGRQQADTEYGAGEGVWPAEEVSPWFHGVFWDDLLLILNPVESTLVVLALTSE